MQFKSVKSCLKRLRDETKQPFKNALVLAFISMAIGLGSFRTASAIITLTPASGGPERVLSNGGGPISNHGGGTFFYWISYNGTTGTLTNSFMPSGTGSLPFVIDQPDRVGLSNMIEINLSSSLTNWNTTGGQQVVVWVQALSSSGAPSPARPAPIAAVNGVICGTNGNCGAPNNNMTYQTIAGYPLSPSGLNPYYAANFYPTTNATLRIGLFPQDICNAYFKNGGGDAAGCTNGSISPVATGAPVTMQLNFYVSTAWTAGTPTATSLDSITQPLTLSFTVDTPTLACTAATTSSTNWYPGDGQIMMNASVFGGAITGAASPVNLIVVGGASGASYPTAGNPVVGSTYASNPLVVTVPLSGTNQTIKGFTNTTATDPHIYNLSFMVQDSTGLIASPSTASSCLLTGVQAAAIQGFISNKGSCFIATAAFGSADASPVAVLREFRDQVLLPSQWGQEFVRWYYSWSPDAADWLSDHPVFRLPVLLWLAPFELLAWIWIHPLDLWVFLLSVLSYLATIGVILGFLRLVSRRGEHE